MSTIDAFTPGERIIVEGETRHIKPTISTVKLIFPVRVHISLLDANRFNVGQPGAGGLGFAVGLQNTMQVSLADRDQQENAGEYQPVLAHITLVMKKLLGFDGGIRVTLQGDPALKLHSGLGSTISVTTACAEGINILFGRPLGMDELRRLVGHNYVEAYGRKLVRGTETGVGSCLVLNGGFVVVTTELRIIYSGSFLPAYSIALVFPRVTRFSHQEPQDLSELERIKEEDLAFRYYKAYAILLDLIPALYRQDFTKIGDIVWRLQFGGNNLLEFEKYPNGGQTILTTMRSLRYGLQPKPIVGISSLGPVVFAIYEDENALRALCYRCNAEYFLTGVDNSGLQVLEAL